MEIYATKTIDPFGSQACGAGVSIMHRKVGMLDTPESPPPERLVWSVWLFHVISHFSSKAFACAAVRLPESWTNKTFVHAMDYKGLVAVVMESLCSSCWQPSLLKPFILNLHIIPLYTRIIAYTSACTHACRR